jgi:hypothetical protein
MEGAGCHFCALAIPYVRLLLYYNHLPGNNITCYDASLLNGGQGAAVGENQGGWTQ